MESLQARKPHGAEGKSRTPSPSHFWANRAALQQASTKPRGAGAGAIPAAAASTSSTATITTTHKRNISNNSNNSNTSNTSSSSPLHLWGGASVLQEPGAMPFLFEAALHEVAAANRRPFPPMTTPPSMLDVPPGLGSHHTGLDAPSLLAEPMLPLEQDLYGINLPFGEANYTPQRMMSPRNSPSTAELAGYGAESSALPQDGRCFSGASSAAASASVPPPPPPPASFISVGSRNHPHACKEPCRYVKRKGGCRYGNNCPSCHLCFWRRPRPAEDVSEGISAISEGTKGHPFTCAPACRYVRRRDGCRDGANCKNCHACFWKRDGKGDPVGSGKVSQPAETDDVEQTTDSAAGSAFQPPLGEGTVRLQGLLAELLLGQLTGTVEEAS